MSITTHVPLGRERGAKDKKGHGGRGRRERAYWTRPSCVWNSWVQICKLEKRSHVSLSRLNWVLPSITKSTQEYIKLGVRYEPEEIGLRVSLGYKTQQTRQNSNNKQ